MKSKAAIQPAPRERLIIDELEIPDPRPDQVVVKLFSSGICHSQLKDLQGSPAHPLVVGHEGTGVAIQVGQEVKHVKEGDHVIVTWVHQPPLEAWPKIPPSGTTFRGQPVAALAGVYTWSEYTLAEGGFVVPISKDDPTDLSCIVGCAVLTGAGAVLHTANVRPNESVAVFGVGGVGLSAIRMAALLEAYPIIAVDLKDDKLAYAKEFGATHGVNAGEGDAVEAIVELTSGGVDYAFDAIGLRVTNEQIQRATRPGWHGAHNHGGMAILIGIPGSEMTLNPLSFMFEQKQYRGSHGACIPDQDFPMYLRWHREGKFPLDKLVTTRYPLEQANEACDALKAGEILGRAIIEF